MPQKSKITSEKRKPQSDRVLQIFTYDFKRSKLEDGMEANLNSRSTQQRKNSMQSSCPSVTPGEAYLA